MDDRYIILCLLFMFVPINFAVLYLVFSKYDVIVKRWNKPKKKKTPEFSQPAEHWSFITLIQIKYGLLHSRADDPETSMIIIAFFFILSFLTCK